MPGENKKGMIILGNIFEYLFCLPFFQLHHFVSKIILINLLNLHKNSVRKLLLKLRRKQA